MRILNELETAPMPFEEEERRHTRRLLIGLLCALLLAGLLFTIILVLRKRHGRELASEAASATNVKLPPKVEVYVDGAMPKDKDTILGGTVHNISKEAIQNLAVELELKRRGGGGLERKTVPLDEPNLLPDAVGHYSLVESAKDYTTAKFLGVVAGEKREAVPYKTFPGVPRPMATPVPDKTIVTKRPAPSGGDFGNTPDRPVRVP